MASWAPATLSREPTFMSANFLPETVIVAESSTTQPFVTCQFPECTPVAPWTGYVCYDNDPEKNICRIQNRPTVDPIGGICRELEHKTTECVAGNVLYLCLVIKVHECGFGPGPTPSPSPTLTPEPCQYCNDPNALRPADCSDPLNPKCGLYEYQLSGCCYNETCERVGITPPHRSPVLQDILEAATNCNRFQSVVTWSAYRILLRAVGVDQQAKPVAVRSVAAVWSAPMDFAAIQKSDQAVLY